MTYKNFVDAGDDFMGDSWGILVVIFHIQSFMLLGICKLPIKTADEI